MKNTTQNESLKNFRTCQVLKKYKFLELTEEFRISSVSLGLFE
jgi:hypothetical protein